MSKQASISKIGGGKQIAQSAPALRLAELNEVISKYAVYNPFTKVALARMQEDVQILEEAIVAGNIQLFWRVYNKVAKQLMQYGIVLPSYIKYSFQLR
jgi:hypothetical protein